MRALTSARDSHTDRVEMPASLHRIQRPKQQIGSEGGSVGGVVKKEEGGTGVYRGRPGKEKALLPSSPVGERLWSLAVVEDIP